MTEDNTGGGRLGDPSTAHYHPGAVAVVEDEMDELEGVVVHGVSGMGGDSKVGDGWGRLNGWVGGGCRN